MSEKSSKRQPLSKKLRFEVLKRDSFKCTYCGKSAPDVYLEVDHIEPVSKGGTNELENLTTSCFNCNRGKGARTLDDNTVVQKKREQYEQLQGRKEQLEMMMEWMRGLKDLKDQQIDGLHDYWRDLAPGWTISDHGKRNLKKWLRKFSHEELLVAMDIAAEQYLKFEDDGTVTESSWSEAYGKIPGICYNRRRDKENPEKASMMRICASLEKYHGYVNRPDAIKLLKEARSEGVLFSDVDDLIYEASSWTNFRNLLEDKIIECRKSNRQPQKDSSPQEYFPSEDEDPYF